MNYCILILGLKFPDLNIKSLDITSLNKKIGDTDGSEIGNNWADDTKLRDFYWIKNQISSIKSSTAFRVLSRLMSHINVQIKLNKIGRYYYFTYDICIPEILPTKAFS